MKIGMNFKKLLAGFALLLAGFVLGGFAFTDTQSRNLLKVEDCRGRCGPGPQVAGLLTLIGVKLAPDYLPNVVAESPQCFAVISPTPETPVDILFFPKRDMKHLLDLDISRGDQDYILGCYALMRKVIADRGIQSWLVYSNGPGLQKVAYLHFHLLAQSEAVPK